MEKDCAVFAGRLFLLFMLPFLNEESHKDFNINGFNCPNNNLIIRKTKEEKILS